MDFDYGFWFYYFFEEEEKTPTQLFFSNVKVKLEAFEHQVKVTGELYQTGHDASAKQLQEAYDSAMEKANAKYQEVYNKYAGDPPTRNQIATHESGIDQIENWYRDQDEPRFYRFRDMKDSYYKSAVIILQAQFEAEAKHLCELLKQQFQATKGLRSISGSDGLILQLNRYLDDIIGLDLNEVQSFIQKMDDFRHFRNLLTHEMGKVSQHEPWLTNILVNQNFLELEPLGQHEQIRLYAPDYLYDYQTTLCSYFRGLYWAVDELDQYSQLSEKLKHLFGFIDPKNLKISQLSVTNIAQTAFNKEINMHLEYDRNPPLSYTVEEETTTPPVPGLHTIAVKVTFAIGTNDILKISNRLSGDEKLSRLKRNLEQNPEVIFNQIFNLFYFQTNGRIMEITFSELPV